MKKTKPQTALAALGARLIGAKGNLTEARQAAKTVLRFLPTPSICDYMVLPTEPPLSLVVNPSADRPEADLDKIIAEGAVVLVNTAHAENAAELLPVQLLLKLDFYRRILSRPRANTNQERPVWLFIDEFNRVFSARGDSEANFLESARSSRCGAILATQSLSGLLCRGGPYLEDKLTSLMNNQVFLANTDLVTIAWAERCLGTKTTHGLHQSVEAPLPPPLLVPSDGVRPARRAACAFLASNL